MRLNACDTLLRDQIQPLPYHAFEHRWKKSAASVGTTINFHSLWHHSGIRYAQTGAALKETMARLGHSSPVTAMRYQDAGARDDELARRAAPMACMIRLFTI